MQYLYNDGQFWTLMDPNSFEQIQAGEAAMADAAQWLKGEETVRVTLWNGVPLSVAAPNTVELKITETDPGLRGDTATGGTKPAKLETGAVVKVPLFITEGEKIKRSEEHTSELQSLMRISYAVFCLKKKKTAKHTQQ